ncbi:MAG: RdgB/HAM1 family non-canonical purine NTP pyrophosphatase [Mariprofundaceae bacterium]
MKLVIASNNIKKRAEIHNILLSLGIHIVPIDATISIDVIEDGHSFQENARKKAEAFAKVNQTAALADDSGLCVAALNGAPGIHSSRYASEACNDHANNTKLLNALENVEDRSASFICALHLAFPDGRKPYTAEGRVDGFIEPEFKGHGGFGYDPLFFSPELGKVFADATPEEKASVSHRGRALRQLKSALD